jgi:hypothetical protein
LERDRVRSPKVLVGMSYGPTKIGVMLGPILFAYSPVATAR